MINAVLHFRGSAAVDSGTEKPLQHGNITPIADEECIVLLGRLAREDASFRPAVLDALDAIDHPRADKAAAALRTTETAGTCRPGEQASRPSSVDELYRIV